MVHLPVVAFDDVERARALGCDLAEFALDDAVELAGAGHLLAALGHHLRRFRLFDPGHLVAALDQQRRILGEAALRKSAMGRVSLHQKDAELLDGNERVHMVQLVEFAHLEEEDDVEYEYSDIEVEVEDEWDDRGVAPALLTTYDPEMRIHMLIVHGMLHLVGYDHEDDDEYELMVVKEDEVMAELKRRLGNDFGLIKRALPG